MVLLISFCLYRDSHKKKLEYDKKPVIVKNFNDFYTISNCVDKYLNYVKQKDVKGTLSLLTKNYLEENRINTTNVFEKIDLGNNPIFIPNKVLYKHISKDEYKYYIYGLTTDFKLNSTTGYDFKNAKDTYYIIYLNEKLKVFSIEPYDGKEFTKGANNK